SSRWVMQARPDTAVCGWTMELHGPDSIAYIPKHGPCQRDRAPYPVGVSAAGHRYSPVHARTAQAPSVDGTPKMCAPIGCAGVLSMGAGIRLRSAPEQGVPNMGLSLVRSRALLGLDARPVCVEVHLANGLPSF